MRERIIIITVSLVFALILCSLSVVPSQSSFLEKIPLFKSDFDKCIDNMNSYKRNIMDAEFLNNSDAFIRSVKILKDDVSEKRWEDAETHLNETKNNYARLYDRSRSLNDENVTLFMVEAHRAFKNVLDDKMWSNMEEIPESLKELEEKRETENKIYSAEKVKNEELRGNIPIIEAQLYEIKNTKRGTIKEVMSGLIFPILIASIMGFFIFIPWYKRYADKHEYWGSMVKNVEFISPLKVITVILVVAFLVLFGYIIYRGYLFAAIF